MTEQSAQHDPTEATPLTPYGEALALLRRCMAHITTDDELLAEVNAVVINGSTPREAGDGIDNSGSTDSPGNSPVDDSRLADAAAPSPPDLALPWRVERWQNRADDWGWTICRGDDRTVFSSLDPSCVKGCTSLPVKPEFDAICEAVNGWYGQPDDPDSWAKFYRETELTPQQVAESQRRENAQLRQRVAELERERDKAREAADVWRRKDQDGAWYWQADNFDHPENLVCPVLMSADQLRALLNEPKRLRTAMNGVLEHLAKLEKTLAGDINWDVYGKHLLLAQDIATTALNREEGAHRADGDTLLDTDDSSPEVEGAQMESGGLRQDADAPSAAPPNADLAAFALEPQVECYSTEWDSEAAAMDEDDDRVWRNLARIESAIRQVAAQVAQLRYHHNEVNATVFTLNGTASRALGMAETAAEGVGDVRRQINELNQRCDGFIERGTERNRRLDKLTEAMLLLRNWMNEKNIAKCRTARLAFVAETSALRDGKESA